MILTGNQIKRAKEQGYLDISDWDESRLNPIDSIPFDYGQYEER